MRNNLGVFERRPAMPTDRATLAAFDALYDAAIVAGPGTPIDYRLAAPRWQFICHIADTRDVVLHGSGNSHINRFEPRQPQDNSEFGNRNAVYAASDGLWPMYFAILDRDRHNITLLNGAGRPVDAEGGLGEPLYFFSIGAAELALAPWRHGTIYFLPRHSFEQQPEGAIGGTRVAVAQWASAEPVTPLARIEVGPEDFPMLDRIRGHDWDTVMARSRTDPDGFPWVD